MKKVIIALCMVFVTLQASEHKQEVGFPFLTIGEDVVDNWQPLRDCEHIDALFLNPIAPQPSLLHEEYAKSLSVKYCIYATITFDKIRQYKDWQSDDWSFKSMSFYKNSEGNKAHDIAHTIFLMKLYERMEQGIIIPSNEAQRFKLVLQAIMKKEKRVIGKGAEHLRLFLGGFCDAMIKDVKQ